MRKSFICALFLALLAAPAVAQDTINLAALGLGDVVPFTLELDGNPQTVEWAVVQTESGDIWVVNAGGCTTPVAPFIPYVAGNTAATWSARIARIGDVDRWLISDADASDGVAPITIQPIDQGCYWPVK